VKKSHFYFSSQNKSRACFLCVRILPLQMKFPTILKLSLASAPETKESAQLALLTLFDCRSLEIFSAKFNVKVDFSSNILTPTSCVHACKMAHSSNI